MRDLLDHLAEDHANIEAVLALLDRELARCTGASPAPDFERMRDILLYICSYADMAHHPMEDLLFERLVERDARARTEVESISREHESLGIDARRVLNAAGRLAEGAALADSDLASLGRAYVERLRAHMRREGASLFALAEERLTAEDWHDLGARFEHVRDPLFGVVIEPTYRALHHLITRRR